MGKALQTLMPALEANDRGNANAQSTGTLPVALSSSFELAKVPNNKYYLPLRLTTTLTLGQLPSRQQLDFASPSVAQESELLWTSASGSGQVPPVRWTSSDASNQQRSNDALFFAGLLLSVPLAAILAVIDRLLG
jgi:hypothetical protein